MLTVLDRGIDVLEAEGRLGPEAAVSLEEEARRRVETGTFFGHVAYGSVVARKP